VLEVDFKGIYDCEYSSFDMYFASVCSMQFHPGAGTKDHKRLSIDECKDIAMQMLKARRKAALGE
jgi:hypothetical protein